MSHVINWLEWLTQRDKAWQTWRGCVKGQGSPKKQHIHIFIWYDSEFLHLFSYDNHPSIPSHPSHPIHPSHPHIQLWRWPLHWKSNVINIINIIKDLQWLTDWLLSPNRIQLCGRVPILIIYQGHQEFPPSRFCDLLNSMIYDLKRSVDLRWLFDPVLHSSSDDLVILNWSW